ncbi:MAG: hypothetical protein JW888_02640 [Pirellulales bacterium]|nr:hypothetical protein [Pirellulales bacterium]
MSHRINGPEKPTRLAAWTRFATGTLLLGGLIVTLMQGYTPPGPAGDVFRNNQLHDINANPLFYTDVESLVPD